MTEIILTHWQSYLIVHFTFSIIGLAITLLNERYLQVKDFIWAFIFGPLYFTHSVWGFDVVVIDLRKK